METNLTLQDDAGMGRRPGARYGVATAHVLRAFEAVRATGLRPVLGALGLKLALFQSDHGATPAPQSTLPRVERREEKRYTTPYLSQRLSSVDVFLCAVLFFAVITVYFPVGHFDSIEFDDPQTVFLNPHVLSGLTWTSVRWAFTSQTLGIWQPLTMLSFLVDVRLFGLSAGEMHLHNVILHALSTVGWFVLFRGMTGRKAASFFVAGLFALHPAHVESVAWIAERKDVLSMLMLVLSLIAYWRYATTLRWSAYLCSLLFLALALMSKPMMVTQPVLLLLLDFWPLGRTKWWQPPGHQHAGWAVPTLAASVGIAHPASDGVQTTYNSMPSVRRLILEKIPFAMLAMLACAIVLRTQGMEGAYSDLTRVSIGDRLCNSILGYVRYLGTAFWPVNLSVYYPYQFNIPPAAVLASIVLLMLVTALVFRLGRSRPWLLVGWIWFLLTLVPVIGLVQVGGQAIADRYTYLPFIGLAIAVVWPTANLFSKRRWIGAVLGCIVLTACGVQARMYLHCWSNTVSLFTRAANVNGALHPMIEYHLAEGYRIAGKPDLAIDHYGNALQINPDQFGSNLNLANLLETAFPSKALPYYEHALRIKPQSAIAHYDYGVCLQALHRDADAAAEFEIADRLGH